MHNNYHFLKVLSHQLGDELIGYKIGQIFSQSKNELIFSFYKGNNKAYLKAHLSPEFCCLSFPETFSRANRNSVDLFQVALDRTITEIVQIENDRSFYIGLSEGYRILFKMHGNRSNILLFHEHEVAEIFKNSLKQDANIVIEDLSKTIVLDKKEFEALKGNYSKIIPTLGKSFKSYFDAKKYDQVEMHLKYEILEGLLNYLQKPDLYIHYDSADLPQLSLVKLEEKDVRYDSPKRILNEFYTRYQSVSSLLRGKSKLRTSINQQIKKADAYIHNASGKLQRLQHADSYQHLGDLIMANLHNIHPYTSECYLDDFYTQEKIRVLLKKNLNPQLNAENYYRKAKRQKIEIDTLSTNIEAKKKLRKELTDELVRLEDSTDLKSFQKQSLAMTKPAEQKYRILEFMGHEILIGKNAVKNEHLTFKVARKDDLFLHAKDTSGSHVIVKKRGNQNFPKHVIEEAASIAAYYSKNKNESLCSVLYTPRKYVRKAKGAPAGTVIVDREKVILVKPKSLEEF